eukprot:GILK01011268.1.p1 GENE.GILK01011268.1~~GILK01011268.1.p1  ORF type:complete len:1045 (+),score=200.02 GILK01011268.1:87-3221(+)
MPQPVPVPVSVSGSVQLAQQSSQLTPPTSTPPVKPFHPSVSYPVTSPASTTAIVPYTHPESIFQQFKSAMDRFPAAPNTMPAEPLPDMSATAFRRVLNWELNGSRFLLGSNLMIFNSDKEQVPVNLHLVDVKKELSGVTCLDYWLDNVMHGISDLAVCYHRDGFVQGYDLIKTVDIPWLKALCQERSKRAPGSSLIFPELSSELCAIRDTHSPAFDPETVTNNATSILEFLQHHCSREATTYWLYKETGGRSIQLYEISDELLAESLKRADSQVDSTSSFDSLSQPSSSNAYPIPLVKALMTVRQKQHEFSRQEPLHTEGNRQRPFGLALAMLCYRTATRISRVDSRTDSGMNRSFQSSGQSAGQERLNLSEYPLRENDAKKIQRLLSKAIELLSADSKGVHALVLASSFEYLADTYLRPLQLPVEDIGTSENGSERPVASSSECSNVQAATYLLESIRHLYTMNPSLNSMPYDVLVALLERVNKQPTANQVVRAVLRIRNKLCSCHFAIAKELQLQHKYGAALKQLQLASRCIPAKSTAFHELLLGSSLIRWCGDLFQLLAVSATKAVGKTIIDEKISSHVTDFETDPSWYHSFPENSAAWMPLPGSHASTDAEINFNFSIQHYLKAVQMLSGTVPDPIREAVVSKLSSVYNELGCHYIHQGRFTKAHRHYKQGLELFQAVGDRLSEAKQYFHLGQLTIKGDGNIDTASDQMDQRIKQAIDMYQMALKTVDSREVDGSFWRSVVVELGTSYQRLGQRLEKKISQSKHAADIEQTAVVALKDALETFRKLDACDSHLVGNAHYALGTFYCRRCLHTADTDSPHERKAAIIAKTKMELAKRHFEQALYFLPARTHPIDFVLTHLDVIKLHIQFAHGARVQNLEQALSHIIAAADAFLFVLGSPPTSTDGETVADSQVGDGADNKTTVTECSAAEATVSTSDTTVSRMCNSSSSSFVSVLMPSLSANVDMVRQFLLGLWPLLEHQLHDCLKEIIKLSIAANNPKTETFKAIFRTALAHRREGPLLLAHLKSLWTGGISGGELVGTT